jgi:mRNA turnover protein 4
MDSEPAPHSIEPQFRKLGLSSRLVKGVPTLNGPHQIARKGKKLTADEAHLLKLFNVPMAMVGCSSCELMCAS